MTDDRFEIREKFRSLSEWREWLSSRPFLFDTTYAASVVEEIRENGVEDPLNGVRFPGKAVSVDGSNNRESLKTGRLISRTRGLLLEYRRLSEELGRPDLLGQQAKIYAPEALTPFALYMRSHFPRFIGSEYAESPEEAAALYPVEPQDLHSLTFKSNTFDAVFSNDVFEHVHDLDTVLRETCRVTKPGGILVSTFPLAYKREERVVKARKNADNVIEYLCDPEYHGNPMNPDKGSLVFEIPAWDMVARARAAGFADSYYSFISSARYGVLGGEISGVFVFVAIKSDEKMEMDPKVDVEQAVARKTVIGVVGLPRSGTTVFAASLGAHSEIQAIYEPWNARKAKLPSKELGIRAFIEAFEESRIGVRPTMLVKETAANPAYITSVRYLLNSCEPPTERRLLWLFRNPFHTFLSEMEARKEWWGDKNASLSRESFEKWARRTRNAVKVLALCTEETDSAFVSYEAFVEDPQRILASVMEFLGYEFESKQLEYVAHTDFRSVKGDVNVATRPTAVSSASVTRRAEELSRIQDVFVSTPGFQAMQQLEKLAATIHEGGVVDPRSDLWAKVVSELELLSR